MRRLGAFRLSVLSTVLVFVVLPAAFMGIVASLALSGSDRGSKSRRYRPGRPYDFAPIWFLASPEQVGQVGGSAHHRAIEAGPVENSQGERVLPGPTGGASDRW